MQTNDRHTSKNVLSLIDTGIKLEKFQKKLVDLILFLVFFSKKLINVCGKIIKALSSSPVQNDLH